jgi:hypothetical protein
VRGDIPEPAHDEQYQEDATQSHVRKFLGPAFQQSASQSQAFKNQPWRQAQNTRPCCHSSGSPERLKHACHSE